MTALVVQDFLSGCLLRTVVGDVSHYWNECPNGTELDLTREQFDPYLPQGRETRTREYLLSDPDTRRRYEKLRKSVNERLETGIERPMAASVHL